MRFIVLPKNLVSIRFFNIETVGQYSPNIFVRSSIQTPAPITDGEAVNLCGQNTPLKIFDALMDNPVHLRKVRIEPIWVLRN